MDDTSAMWDNWPIGSWHTKLLFDCFSRLILTLKQAPRMHQNAPLPDKKNQKNFSGGGTAPSPYPSPLGRGIPLPRLHPLGASIIAPSVLGVPVPFHLRLEHCLKVSNDGVDVRMSDDRLFHARGPATANARSPMVERRVESTTRSADDTERRRRRAVLATGTASSVKYRGAAPVRQRCMSTHSLNFTRSGTHSQWRSTSSGVTWSYLRAADRRAAALTTDCTRSNSRCGRPAGKRGACLWRETTTNCLWQEASTSRQRQQNSI